MSADPATYLPLIILGLAVAVILLWLFIRSNRKARITDADGQASAIARDVLSEGAAPAQRNQALIDAPRGIDAEAGPGLPPAPAVPVAPTPTPASAPAPAPSGDDLTRIKGLGPKLAALLGELGITTYAQIAAWTPEEIARIDEKLGRFAGRITRDQWVEQARLLAAGDETGFAATYGRNG